MALSEFDRENIDEIMKGHGTWFTARLLRLCQQADANNLAKLQQAFPEEVGAYLKWWAGDS